MRAPSYLKQKAYWAKRKDTKNAHGEYEFDPETEIRVRAEKKRAIVRTATGDQVKTFTVFWCVEPIAEGDMIRFAGEKHARAIQAVADIPRLRGTPFLREGTV